MGNVTPAKLRKWIRSIDRDIAQVRLEAADDWADDWLVGMHARTIRELQAERAELVAQLERIAA